jgi:hypothetical protein
MRDIVGVAAALKIHVLSDMNDIVTDDSEKASSKRSFLLDHLEYADSRHLKNGGNDVYNIPHGCISHIACTFNYISTAKWATFYGIYHSVTVAYPGIFFGGVQQIQLRTENGDLGAVAP